MNVADVNRNVADIANGWAPDLSARLQRRALDPDDFQTLSRAGLTLSGVPEDMGGIWQSPAQSARPVGAIFRTLAQVDPSLALVSTMHTTVLAFWFEQRSEHQVDAVSWKRQYEQVLSAAKAGHWFGTIASEPGSSGDILATRAVAARCDDGSWRMTGEKHMGSGSGVTSFMITFAVPAGEETPDLFLFDARGLPWDGSRGATLVREWDGYGMAATQSHAFRYDGIVVERHALMKGAPGLIPKVLPLIAYMFSSVIMGVLDAALREARRRLKPRAGRMSAFERVSWTKAVNDIWLAEQAFQGMSRAIESGAAIQNIQRGKLAISELAEAALLSMSKAIGGSSFSRSGPFGQWSQDVRALGFLRPPWPLAYERLFEQSFDD